MSLLVCEEVHVLCGLLGVLLFHLPGLGVLEPNNEMDFGGSPAPVWSEHDGIRSAVLELHHTKLWIVLLPRVLPKMSPYHI